ncbi:MAG: TonB-dependent receptor [Candidatus Edwardsbacteria bacterium]|nr:TonB-dependent receptor [Candidatus Edwardsbacteria bacterium]MBU1577293.1 TonB-dependent receptor [Candidatus Edwardsbacteria bacterium]MBU2462842.1 TonB-dependent receptor [Candidatus Edwardsbacteria bacterium]MBU2594894.1 TonB-dependent receptor [Candidatus Edwardsbacteria bacterium]
MKTLKILVAVTVCMVMAGGLLFAGTTGKIVGTVTDSETKEPIPGAVVELLGTTIGANTDMDGRYFIVNVPVGTFSLRARMMGYETVTITNVKSIMDLTTTINFKIKPTVILSEGITVTAQRQMVIPDATSTSRVVSTKEIMAMPNASANNVIGNTAGVVSSGGQMNVRGGRSDEMAIFVDGVSVTDALTGAMGSQINTAAIEEVMVITGGFNAEYGEAMSGVVNVVTKEGGDKLSVYGRFTTDMHMLSDSRNNNKVELSLGGPAPYAKNLGYFLSGEVGNTDDYRPVFMPDKYYEHDPTKDYFWADTIQYSRAEWDPADSVGLIGWKGDWADSSVSDWDAEKARRIALGYQRGWKEYDENYLPHNDYNSYRLQGKVTYKIPAWQAKITLGGFANRDQRGSYTASFKYWLDSYYSYLQKSYQGNASWRHQVSRNTFYNITVNKFSTRTQTGVRDTTVEKDRSWWEDYTFLSDADADGDSMYDAYEGQAYAYGIDNPYGVSGIFYTFGLARLWETTKAEYIGGKIDVTSQVNRFNQMVGGLEVKQHHVILKSNSLPWDPVPFKDYYDFKPITGAAYIQDKLEFQGFIVNAGLRLDLLMPESQKKLNNFNLTDTASYIDAETKYKLSPRLGISHPVSDRTVMHISYGHFFQQPQLQYLYESLSANIARGNTVMGDPDLGAQRTIAYEIGFNQQLTNDMAGDITVYYKDIFDLLGTRMLQDTITGLNYTSFLNTEYGNVRGFEATLNKRASANGIFSGKLAYSLMLAKGTASDPWEGYLNYIYGGGTDPATGLPVPFPKSDAFLEYDQRHTFSVSTNFDFGEKFGPAIAGFKPLANLSISLLNNIGSGMPYTIVNSKGVQIGGVNEGRMPWTLNTDLLLSRSLTVAGIKMSIDFEVLNLLNRKNVANVFAVTGNPLNDGSIITLGDFTTSAIPCSVSYTVDGAGDPVYVPNPYYSKWRDINGDGEVDQYEKYVSYVAAWDDYITDPFTANRTPNTRAYAEPRRSRLALSFSF